MDTLSVNYIKKTDDIILYAERANKKVEFNLKFASVTMEDYIEIKNKVGINFIPIEVVVTEWKKKIAIISFLNAKANMYVVVTRGAKAYRWNQIDIKMLTLKSGKRVHVILTKSNKVKGFDRRKGTRHEINRVMRVSQGEASKLVTITDLSYTGMSFDEPAGDIFDSSEPIVLELSNPKTAKVVAKVPMAIVRRIKHEDGSVTTGCKTTTEYYLPMTKYISNYVIDSNPLEERQIILNDSSKNWAFIAAAKMQETLNKG